MAGSRVDKILSWLTGVDHETVGELHTLSSRSAQLSGDDDLAALGAALHNEAQDSVTGSADSKTVKQLVTERLALCNGGETTVLDLGGVERDAVLRKLEALLDEGGELADAASLLAENFLGVRGADDDVGNGGSDADFDARVALFRQFTLEELVQLGVEDSICDKLSPLRAARLLVIRLLGELLGMRMGIHSGSGDCRSHIDGICVGIEDAGESSIGVVFLRGG